jgi:hypothetical protein
MAAINPIKKFGHGNITKGSKKNNINKNKSAEFLLINSLIIL